MKKKVLIFFLFYLNVATAQVDPGAKQIALSHSTVASSFDVFTLFGNPAGIAQINSNQIGLYYSPSPFGIKELANGFLAFNHPTSFGNFAVGFMNYGFELYKENRIQFGYSKRFDDNILIGITSFYQSINIKNYGNKGFINFTFGGIFLINENLAIGFDLHNPLRNIDYSNLTTSLRTGLSFKPIKAANINLAIHKELSYPISISFGTEYNIVEFLDLRLGITNEPNSYSGGIGINYNYFHLDYAITSHPELGITHQISLIVNFEND